jgi:hypothetical protein
MLTPPVRHDPTIKSTSHDYSSSNPKVVNSNAMDIDPHILDDDLSTDTLLGHDMVPEGLPASRKEPAEQQVHHIKRVRYLVVDQTANRRCNLKVSKIWQYGMELRAFDRPNLDKYWLYH